MKLCGKYLGDNDATCPQLTCVRERDHDGNCDNVRGDEPLDRVFPDTDPKADPGWRIHVYREPYGHLYLAEERVLPEKVADPQAHRVIESRRIILSDKDVRWLRDQFNEIVATMDAELAEIASRPAVPTGCANVLHTRSMCIAAKAEQCPDCLEWVAETLASFFPVDDEVSRGA